MADDTYTGGAVQADHLCVLVHGLWGNPAHMANVAKTLRSTHGRDKVYILVASRNTSTYTYDGIEIGGERLCWEIEEELEAIKSKGGKIKKLSFVGYSMGGLVARYAIGLLHAKGFLDTVECMTFTAFASPFIGVRSPLRGAMGQAWNVVGARALCVAGWQLFGIDKFRDTGKPLIEVLADPNSIFILGLAKFKRRILYANIVNDRSVVYYSASISKTDPYVDMKKIKPNFVPGYDDVILDPDKPFQREPPAGSPPPEPLIERAQWLLVRCGFAVVFSCILPVFLLQSGFQALCSAHRIRLHEAGKAGIKVDGYRGLPVLLGELGEAVEGAYESINGSQDQEYLRVSDGEDEGVDSGADDAITAAADKKVLALERTQSRPQEPTLALAPAQFAAIRGLHTLSWRKYPVWIRRHMHTHAAIVVRMDKGGFEEGRKVLKHWVSQEFLI